MTAFGRAGARHLAAPRRSIRRRFTAENPAELDVIVEGTLAFPFIGNMPQTVTAELVRSAVLDTHRLGSALAEKMGDAACRRVQGR